MNMKKLAIFIAILCLLTLSCSAKAEAPAVRVPANTETLALSETDGENAGNEATIVPAQWKPNMDPLPAPRSTIFTVPSEPAQPHEGVRQEQPPARQEAPPASQEPPPPARQQPARQDPPPARQQPPPARQQPAVRNESPPPPPQEATFDPGSITQEVFDTTKLEVQQLIDTLNRIIRSRDFNGWLGNLSEEYRAQISSPDFLQQISDSPALKSRNIVVTTPQEYFTNVVVPSRANDRVDDIEFVSQQRVMAYTNTNRGQRLRLYDLEKIEDKWKIVN